MGVCTLSICHQSVEGGSSSCGHHLPGALVRKLAAKSKTDSYENQSNDSFCRPPPDGKCGVGAGPMPDS